MATIEDLAATMRAGLLAAFGATVDADKAEWCMRGLAADEARRIGYDIDNYTVPEDFLGLARDRVIRFVDDAWLSWDRHLQEDDDQDGYPKSQDPDDTDPTVPLQP